MLEEFEFNSEEIIQEIEKVAPQDAFYNFVGVAMSIFIGIVIFFVFMSIVEKFRLNEKDEK